MMSVQTLQVLREALNANNLSEETKDLSIWDIESESYIRVTVMPVHFMNFGSLTQNSLQSLIKNQKHSRKTVFAIPDGTTPSPLPLSISSHEFCTEKQSGHLFMLDCMSSKPNYSLTGSENDRLLKGDCTPAETCQHSTSKTPSMLVKKIWLARLSSCPAVRSLVLACFAIATILLFIGSGLLALVSRHTTNWISYPTPNTQGPRIQLRIDSSNSSAWSAANPKSSTEYLFRIDDQTMIPAHLMTSQEARYQQYFDTNYPQLSKVYEANNHLNATYLKAVENHNETIDIDLKFHLSHCVLALRRYWIARETGKHVCPRDVDPGHIGHCLSALDEWAFPSPGRDTGHSFITTIGALTWITQVCVENT